MFILLWIFIFCHKTLLSDSAKYYIYLLCYIVITNNITVQSFEVLICLLLWIMVCVCAHARVYLCMRVHDCFHIIAQNIRKKLCINVSFIKQSLRKVVCAIKIKCHRFMLFKKKIVLFHSKFIQLLFVTVILFCIPNERNISGVFRRCVLRQLH